MVESINELWIAFNKKAEIFLGLYSIASFPEIKGIVKKFIDFYSQSRKLKCPLVAVESFYSNYPIGSECEIFNVFID